MKKSLAVSKSLLYSKLRSFGVYALSVGFAVDRGNFRSAKYRQGGCVYGVKCVEACDELLDS